MLTGIFRTHRERKESYARSLEDEVLKLRSNGMQENVAKVKDEY
jgi:hypothetical protein